MRRSTARVGAISLGVIALLGCRPVAVNLPEPDHGMLAVGVTGRPGLSDDGDVVAFESSDFLSGEDDLNKSDIWARDVRDGHTQLMSISPGGAQDPCGSSIPVISGDGRSVSWSACSGLWDVPPPPGTVGTNLFVRDRSTGAVEHIGIPEELGFQGGGWGLLDDDATHIVLGCDPGPRPTVLASVCVQDRRTHETTVVARRTDGQIVPGFVSPTSISDDGNLVTFAAPVRSVIPGSTDNRLQLFVRDVAAGVTQQVIIDPAILPSHLEGRISGDGTAAVVWQTGPPYHVAHKDLVTGAVRRVDQADCTDVAPSTDSPFASISDDGDVVAFHSTSAELVANDTNGHEDVFVWRAGHPCTLQRVSVDLGVREGDGDSYWPEVSGDGSSVAFVSAATNFPNDPTPDAVDAFVVRIGPRGH